MNTLQNGRIGGLMTLVVVGLQQIQTRKDIFIERDISQNTLCGTPGGSLRLLLRLHHLGQGRLAGRSGNAGIDDLRGGLIKWDLNRRFGPNDFVSSLLGLGNRCTAAVTRAGGNRSGRLLDFPLFGLGETGEDQAINRSKEYSQRDGKASHCRNGMKPRGQNQADQRESGEDEEGTKPSKDIAAQHEIKPVAEPSPGPLESELRLPIEKNQLLEIKQGRPTQDKDKSPTEADAEMKLLLFAPFFLRSSPHTPLGELRDPETKKRHCGEVGGGPEKEVKDIGDDRPHAPDEVQGRVIDGGMCSERPRGYILRVKGAESQQEEHPSEEEEHTNHLVHGTSLRKMHS